MDWLVELAKCPTLLTLIPGYTTPFEKGRAVGELFETILEDAYLELRESRGSPEDKYAMAASQVLAGAALLGLVTEWPSEAEQSSATRRILPGSQRRGRSPWLLGLLSHRRLKAVPGCRSEVAS